MIREEEEKEMKGFVSPTKMIMMVVVIGEDSKTNKKKLSQCRELNSGPLPYQGSALPLSYTGVIGSFIKRAGDEIRTRDPQLGRLTLYQLSYSRF